MVTRAAARLVGGTMKFGPCTTSTAPVQASMVGAGTRSHSARIVRAGMGQVVARTPAGRRRSSSAR
jgi:hypothetical protein